MLDWAAEQILSLLSAVPPLFGRTLTTLQPFEQWLRWC